MKTTPFIEMHKAAGGKLVDFAGFQLPISFKGIKEEHQTVRENAGVFDVSHMGEFLVEGAHALDLLQKITCNNLAKTKKGKAQYTCLINEKGGIIDDLLIYCLEENQSYLLVVNAANIEKDWNWIVQHNTENVSLQNISNKTCQLAIQGPNAIKIISHLTDVDLAGMKFYTFEKGRFAGLDNVLISATGYTGSGGVEIYFEDKENQAKRVWESIFADKEKTGIEPIGLGARDTLRMEMGFCLYGNDIDDTTTPLEAKLGWITKLSKGEFIGKEAIEKQKAEGVTRKLVGFELKDRGIPRKDYDILNEKGEEIGRVTSGTQSPSLKKPIGLGYVKREYVDRGTEIFIAVRKKKVKAVVCKVPFE